MAPTTPIVEKIQLMLAKAESTTPAEAEMIMAQVEKLMIRHGLDEEMLAAASPKAKTEKIVTKLVTFTSGSYASAYVSMAYSAVSAFGTMRALQSGRDNTKTIWIIGHESDVANAEMMVQSLRVQADHAMREWWKNEGQADTAWLGRQEQWKARRQFFVSFGYGVASRIRSATQAVVTETTGSELVLVGRKERVDDYVGQQFPKLGRARGIDGSDFGKAAGFHAGTQAHTGKSIGR